MMVKKIGGFLIAVAPLSAFATGTDYSSLTSAIDFSTVATALLVVAAAIAGVKIVWFGAKMILGALTGR